MAKVKITGHASGSGVLTITAPNTSTDRTVTLPDSTGTLLDTTSGLDATKLSGNLPAISAASLTNVPKDVTVGGRKNLIINGDMEVAQRATTSSATGVKTVDRWNMGASVGATQSKLALTSGAAFDAGFRSSYKITNTGAISDTAGGYVSCFQYIEAQDLAKSGWNYTSSSNFITISFWIKSSIAGTYYVNPMSQDGTKKVYPQSFSLNANTWTKVEKTYAGVSGLEFANDTGRGMQLHISPFYGTNFTDSGVSTSAWSNYGSATRFPDYAQNWGASTGATWEITGVQLELGSVATDFEHRSFGEELALCERYYQKTLDYGTAVGTQTNNGINYIGGCVYGNTTSGYIAGTVHLNKPMRATPTVQTYDGNALAGKVGRDNYAVNNGQGQTRNIQQQNDRTFQIDSSGSHTANVLIFHYTADAEL